MEDTVQTNNIYRGVVTWSCRPLPFPFRKPCGLGAQTGTEAPQVGGSKLPSPDMGEKRKYHYLLCPSSNAHVELTGICIQLRSTRQFLAPWMHPHKLRVSAMPPSPLQLHCQGTSPPWRRQSAALPSPPNSSLRFWPCQHEPTKYIKKASVFSN